ncbi:hypothetical protein [Bacillus marinisedimentorum]|uniref:hypothetical protein n=1 Tax=Bacillus marinisedimentorum TaxID=1821260 RepID=UPI0007E1699D|nr:hypothetical protein [Bacillus marinisedimentorum]
MKKAMALLFFASLFLLAGCAGKEELYFEGESESWFGQLTVTQLDEEQYTEAVLRFQGDKSKHLADVDYEIKGPSFMMGGTENTVTNATIPKRSSCTDCPEIEGGGEYTVTIKWDGQVETFTMKETD